jgi:predicted O-linked N-acetylglucosamine transferase (SPINDLY family)
MIELSDHQKIKLANLFKNKKFSELEFELESISSLKDRTSFLSNLLGIVKIQKESSSDSDYEEALMLFKDSCLKDPDNIDALCNYSQLGLKLFRYEDAFQKLQVILKKGYNAKIYQALARIYYFTGEINKALLLLETVIDKNDASRETAAHFLAASNYTNQYSQSEYLDYCKKINENFKPKDLSNLQDFSFEKNPKILKVGFLSPDFCDHAITQFFLKTLEELKNYNFKIYAFNLRSTNKLDEFSKEYKKLFDEWHDVNNLSDLEVANLIRKNKIHILIDLVGYFARNRFPILKYKPAPVQALWLGYVNTTGIEEIDYIITDPNLIKEDEKKLYSEKIINLPNIWNCHSVIDHELEINELPYYKNNFFTFGCFNNSSKISDETIEVWSKILFEVDNSKLILKAVSRDAETAHKNFLDKFKKFKIDESRIIILPRTKNRKDHYKLYNKIDLALDTFPYPGVTTSFEAVWMGVPFLTLEGNNFVSRCGKSINLNLGMEDFIASNLDDYINKAVSFSKEHKKLSEIRKLLRKKAINSPLFNSQNFGKNLSGLLNTIWKNNLLKNN